MSFPKSLLGSNFPKFIDNPYIYKLEKIINSYPVLFSQDMQFLQNIHNQIPMPYYNLIEALQYELNSINLTFSQRRKLAKNINRFFTDKQLLADAMNEVASDIKNDTFDPSAPSVQYISDNSEQLTELIEFVPVSTRIKKKLSAAFTAINSPKVKDIRDWVSFILSVISFFRP